MASVDSIQASLDRMEREQKVRDNGIRRALDLYANEFRRMQTMIGERVAETHEVMDGVSELLTRQNSLIASIRDFMGEPSDDPDANEADDEGWNGPLPSVIRPPGD